MVMLEHRPGQLNLTFIIGKGISLYVTDMAGRKEAELAPMDFSREKEVPEDKEAAEAEKAEDEASKKTEIIDESVKADDKTDIKKTE